MIKQWCALFVLAVLALSNAAMAGETGADSFTLDGVIYEDRGGELWVAGFDDDAETIVYREEVDGKVVNIEWNAIFDINTNQYIHLNNPGAVKTLVIDEGVTVIDKGFMWDTLETIKLPASLNDLAPGMFGYLSALKDIEVAQGNAKYGVFNGALVDIPAGELLLYPSARSVDSYTLPSVVKSVDFPAFNYDLYIREIVVPEGVTRIGSLRDFITAHTERLSLPASLAEWEGRTVYERGKLSRIDVDPANPVFYSDDGIVFLRADDSLFAYPPAHSKALVIDDRYVEPVTNEYNSEEYGFFYNNMTIESVAFETRKLTEIPAALFEGCTSLRQAALPLNLKKIGYAAFGYCLSLESIALPPGLEEIGESAFVNCSRLETVVIPDSVAKIGVGAFATHSSHARRPTLICKKDSAGYWYAYQNGLPWAESPNDTPRLLSFDNMRGYPAAVVNGESGGTIGLLEQPSPNSRSVTALRNGATMLIDFADGWSRVRVDGKEGYMMEKFLRLVLWDYNMSLGNG